VSSNSRKLTKSEQMARVRSSDTSIEIFLRRTLWKAGLRFRLRPRIPGTPDIAFVSARIALFVDGCFWHCCPLHYRAPQTNTEFWCAKYQRNQERDRRVTAELTALGWKVIRFWEHDLKDRRKVEALISRLQRQLCTGTSASRIP